MSVSVIIPTYNRSRFVCEAVASALAQSQPPSEVIVIDDGSTDDTAAVLHRRYGDRIRYIQQDRRGKSAARNSGAQRATGHYLAFLDSDDLWTPTKLERQLRLLEADPAFSLVHCFTKVVDTEGREHQDLTEIHQASHQRAFREGYGYKAL
ncbi:MAG: glycosyltransferase family 2 protein, partial [Candidatus Latescibacteria bacterium]|nr:glycosyltransferase family 2 protein [Candidatus Latescibacterota bacterium]